MAWKRKLSEVEKVEYREKKQEEMQDGNLKMEGM